jgi:arsenate reductase-like glutaredoxin family protein
MPVVQIFGVKNSADTRAAERFFKERRAQIQMIDLLQKPMAPAEIRRFVQRFTLTGLLDTEGKAFQDAGVAYMRLSESNLLERLEREPKLLRLPLVRCGNLLALGKDEAAWRAML